MELLGARGVGSGLIYIDKYVRGSWELRRKGWGWRQMESRRRGRSWSNAGSIERG